MADQGTFEGVLSSWGELIGHSSHLDQQLEADTGIGSSWASYTDTVALDDQEVPDPSLLVPVFVQPNLTQSSSLSVDHINSGGLPYFHFDQLFPSAESIADNKVSDLKTFQSLDFASVPIRPALGAFSPPNLNHWDSRWTSPLPSFGVETDSPALQTLPAQFKTSPVEPRRRRRVKKPVVSGPNRFGRMGTTRCLQCRKRRHKASHLTPSTDVSVSTHLSKRLAKVA
jgi:hypothetical protein